MAFDELFEKYNEKVYVFSLKNMRNKQDAEGIVQEVFLNLWKDKEKLIKVQDLDAWIFTISFNIIRKEFRKLARERHHLKNPKFAQSHEDNSTVTDVEYKDMVYQASKIIE